LQAVIDRKFIDAPAEPLEWPTLTDRKPSRDPAEVIDSEVPYRQYWSSVRLPMFPSQPIDLSPLPSSWAVVSISVSDDMSSMFVTRHQRDVSPVIFCLPFGRQGKREIDEDEGLPFELARDEMRDIVNANDETGRTAKTVTDTEGRRAWWRTRRDLDARLKTLLEGMEEHWFGAFKVSLWRANAFEGYSS
jgi:separase